MITLKTLKKAIKLSLGVGLFTFFISYQEPAIAVDTCDDNPATLTESCRGTPDRYLITVYEMGLCTADPLSGNNFDKTSGSCVATLSSTNGLEANLAGSATQDLSGGTSTRPSDNTYTYAYIVIGNDFGLNGTYTVNDVPYYSTDSGGADTSAPAENWTQTLDDFSSDNSCTTSMTETVSTGVIKARLTDTALSTTTDGTCGSDRLVGTFAFNTPITIDQTTNGLEVSFTVNNSGMTVIPNAGNDVGSFSGGPFKPTFVKF